MNLQRRVGNEQAYYLRQIAAGRLVLRWSATEKAYFTVGWLAAYGMGEKRIPHGKLTGRWRWGKTYLLERCIVELQQRGLLVDEGGWLVLSREAARVFYREAVRVYGPVQARAAPPRVLKMSRTRAARVQG